MIAPLDNKTQIARQMGISRSSLYYRSTMLEKDQKLKEAILTTLSAHPSYGHRRLALHLKRNRKCILRIMKKFGIKPYRRRSRRLCKPGDCGKHPLAIANFAKTLCPLRRNILWASDFTYFWFHGKFWYLCTILDLFSREIIGFSFAGSHDQSLVLNALSHALLAHPAPQYLHTDQGSEYACEAYFQLLKAQHIQASSSTKASPWQNGFQESFYSEFKKDLGDVSRFETIALFMEAIFLQLYYYNNLRLHTKLKTTPTLFKQPLLDSSKLC